MFKMWKSLSLWWVYLKMEELNKFTTYTKYSSPFKKDEKFMNTTELSQKLPKGRWIKTEKVDGTNIRIILDTQDENRERNFYIGSRKLILNQNDKSSNQFFDCLNDINIFKLIEYFKDVKQTIIIYGEGYGAGVQKGGIYSPKKNFRVFDIRIGNAYQDWEYIEKVCIDNQLNIVPVIGECEELNYEECIKSLNEFQNTLINEGDGGKPEGVVYKFEPVLLNKYGERLIFKVKFKDFVM
jgi:hypothetical protein